MKRRSTHKLAARLMRTFIRILPNELQSWGQAIAAEVDSVEGTFAPLAFALSGMFGLTRMWLQHRLKAPAADASFPRRPLSVTLIAIYHAAFSCLIVGVLLEQLLTKAIHESWRDALFPVAFAFLIALVPSVVALGLWVMDNAARWMCMLFTIAHALSTWALLSSLAYSSVRTEIAWLRLLLDAAILASLNLPGIRKAFRNQSAELRLHKI